MQHWAVKSPVACSPTIKADTMQMADWAYGAGPHPTWHRWNIIRHCRKWGIQPIGKRMTGKDGRPRLVWALRKLDEDCD